MTANSPTPSSRTIRLNVATYQIVSRSRSRTRRWIPSRDDVASLAKAIPVAAHCLDQLDRKFVVDLPTQATHQYLEHVGERIVVFVPHMGSNCSSIDDLSMMENEEFEQRKLLSRQLNRLAGASHALRFQINFEIRHAEGFRQWCAAPTRQRSDSRQQLPERERFREIVVGAYFQPGDAIVNGVTRRQHQDRRRDLPGTQLAAEVEPASTRQHHIEDDDVKSTEQRFHLSVGVVGDSYNLNSVLGEAGLDDSRQPGVVFD